MSRNLCIYFNTRARAFRLTAQDPRPHDFMTIHSLFSAAWARACADAINNRPSYREAAATWEGAVMLVMTPDSAAGVNDERRVFLDLWHGECREARAATAQDEEAARYVMSGAAGDWVKVLSGKLPPLMAIITGRLHLAKGNIVALLPYAHAAKELVGAVGAVRTDSSGIED